MGCRRVTILRSDSVQAVARSAARQLEGGREIRIYDTKRDRPMFYGKAHHVTKLARAIPPVGNRAVERRDIYRKIRASLEEDTEPATGHTARARGYGVAEAQYGGEGQ